LILALCELQCFLDDARAVHGFEPQDLTVERALKLRSVCCDQVGQIV